MDDNLNSSNDSICSVFDSYDYVIVAAVSVGSAMVSALCCVFVICLIFLFKKHYFFIQRIILYHCLTALFRSLSEMLRLHRLGYRSNSEAINVMCVISGFTTQVTAWSIIMDYSIITFILLMTAVFRKNVSHLEGLFVVLIFIFPLTFNWIPFINNSYGRSGPWCWIRNLNFEDCSEYRFGIILRNILLNVPQYVFLAIEVPLFLFIIIYIFNQKYCRKSVADNDEQTKSFNKHLNKEVLPLLFFPFGVALLNIAPLVVRIYISLHEVNPPYALWILSAITSPLQGGYIAVVYTLDGDTLKRLSYTNLVATLCKRKEDIQEYPIEIGPSDSTLSPEGFETEYDKHVN